MEDWIVWLLVGLGVLAVAFGVFVAVQRTRRRGGVVVRRDADGTATEDAP